MSLRKRRTREKNVAQTYGSWDEDGQLARRDQTTEGGVDGTH